MADQSAEHRVATVDGAELRVVTQGRGPPLLLIAGLGGTADFWRPVSTRLDDRYGIIRFDQRGIAASTRGTATDVTIARLADDCIAVLDALGVAACDVIGHSTGGAIAQHLAVARRARIGRLVLSGTWLGPNPYMGHLFRARRQILDAAPEAYAAFVMLLGYTPAHLETIWPTVDRAVAAAPRFEADRHIIRERIDALLAFDGRSGARSIMQPTLVIGARDDIVVPPHLQVELAAAIRSARHAELETGGHFFPVSETELFCGLVSSWLDGQAK